MPFAEHVPLSNIIPYFNQFTLDSGGVPAYDMGASFEMLDIEGTQVGVLICFESFFPVDAIRYKNLGADVLLVITQDGWWNSDTARAQHFAYTGVFAAAAGIPVIQASVDGFSGVFNGLGRAIQRSETGTSILYSEIEITDRQTLYSRTGDLPVLLFIMCSLIVYLLRSNAQTRYK